MMADDFQPSDVLQTVTCWRCGKTIAAGTAHCPFCEATLAGAARVAEPARPVQPDRSVVRLLVAFAILLGTSLVGHFATIVTAAQKGNRGDAGTHLLLAPTLLLEGVDCVVIVAALVLIPVAARGPRRGWRTRAAVWAAAVPLLAALLAFNVAYHYYLRGIAQIDLIAAGRPDPQLLPLWLLALCVQPAIFEELFFRYLAIGVLRSIVGVGAAVVVSSVMFGMMHLGMPLSIPMLIVLGLGLGWARVSSGGIVLPMLLHFLHNLAVAAIQWKWI